MPKIVQNEYTKAYNKEHYKNVSIKISPEEAAEIDEIARQTGQSKARLIVNAVRFYARSLTAAGTPKPGTPTPETPSPAPEEISPGTVTGAEGTNTETATASKASTETSPEEIAEEIKAAYLKGYRQARQEIKAAQTAARQTQHIRHTAQRTRVLTQARRRPKAYKG